MEVRPTQSNQTRWLNKNGLMRPGVYIPRDVWERFEQAVAVKNYERAQEGLSPISRTAVVTDFMKKWSAKMLG